MECKQCTTCCRHVAIQIDTPRSKEDFKDIIWYIMHEKIKVFIADDDNKWYIEFKTPCKALKKNGDCNIYEQRPDICKNYSSENCEKNGVGSPYKKVFRKKKEVEDYVKKNTIIKNLY